MTAWIARFGLGAALVVEIVAARLLAPYPICPMEP